MFKKYKTKKEEKNISINIIGKKNIPSVQTRLKFKASNPIDNNLSNKI